MEDTAEDSVDLICFTKSNLFSKKQYLFSDSFVKYAEIPLNVLNISSFINMYNHSKNLNVVNIIICLLLSMYIADFVIALIHVYILDRTPISKSHIDETEKKLIINTISGYGSCHHIFPSSYLDVDDTILVRDLYITFTPFFALNHFNTCHLTAYLTYAILYQMSISGLAHKYAHERNHDRYVPKPIKILQDLGLFMSHKIHKTHHEEIHCNYSLLNGLSDPFSNLVIDRIDNLLNITPYEHDTELCKKYVEKYGNEIALKFVGDIEGEMIVKFCGNVIKMKKS